MLVHSGKISGLSGIFPTIRGLKLRRLVFLRQLSSQTMNESVESNVGISAHANACDGFQGIIKQRYADFVVREVSKGDRSVCFLKEMGKGQEMETQLFAEEDAVNNLVMDEFNVEAFMGELNDILLEDSQEVKSRDELRTFLGQCKDRDASCEELFLTDLTSADKQIRTKFHKLIRKHANLYIESETHNVDDVSYIRLQAKHRRSRGGDKQDNRDRNGGRGGGRDGGGGGGGGRGNGKNNKKFVKRANRRAWPETVPDYLQFTLLKENVDSMTAINFMSRFLHLKSGALDYAGTKDKRGVTAQKVTVYRKRPTEIERINTVNRPFKLRVGDFEYVPSQLTMGELYGNRFSIILRALDKSNDIVVSACDALEKSGFINYYGLQRFGKGAYSSSDIGRSIFRTEYKEAVQMLFAPNPDIDKEDVLRAKSLYSSGDLVEALKCTPPSMHAEHAVLKSLNRNKTDYLAAFESIAKGVRLIYVHAYQSLLWNKAVSKRIDSYGLQVMVGDLIVKRDFESSNSDVLQSSINVHVVTQEDVDAKIYEMKDVVMPLPGSQITLPANDIGQYYQEMLRQDGLSLQTFATGNMTYRMSGAYRYVMQYALDFQYKIIHYDRVDDELGETEFNSMIEDRNYGPGSTDLKSTGADGALRALSMDFTLSAGTYATMMLRELTKANTETDYQMQMTAQSKAAEKEEGDAKEEDDSDAASPNKKARIEV